MSNCTQITLAEGVDRYFMRRGIDKKKYFVRYLSIAAAVWKQIFMRTLWAQKSVWQPLKQGRDNAYIDIPADNERVLFVSIVNECGNIVPLFYNGIMSVVPKPKSKKCGCKNESCDCGGLCADANSLTLTTRLMFTINGVDYYEKQWQQICPNGDVLLWTETPTKKFGNLIGDGADFNDDFNEDYNATPAPMSDYSIVTVSTQQKLCSLDVNTCGCVKDTEENEALIAEHCSCFLPHHACNRKRQCNLPGNNINDNHYGEVKLSECGTRIIYKPSRKWREATKKHYPDFLLLNYQTNGVRVGSETVLPETEENLLFAGIDYESKRFNDRYSRAEKLDAKYAYEEEKSNSIVFHNPIDMPEIGKIQDTPIKY